MTIIPRKGRYGVRVHVDGERLWVGTFPTRREARAAEAAALIAERATVAVPVCDVFADFWLVGYRERTKGSTYTTAQQNLGRFKADFKGRELTSVTPLEAEEWARGNRHRVQTVTTLFNDAIRKRLVVHNPFRGLGGKGRGRKDLVPLTEPEVYELAGCAERALGPYGPQMKALVLFAAFTGLRAGELFALEWRDVTDNRVYVRRRVYGNRVDVPKSGKPERFLSPPARDALLGLPRNRDLVFVSKRGQRLSATTIAWYWPAVWALFGQRVTMHELRHFAGHHMYVTMDRPAREVAEQLGHDSEDQVTSLYGHGNVGALESLEAAWGRKPVPVRDLKVANGGASGA